MTTLSLSRFSRYKDTPVFDDQDGVGTQFGVFVPPKEFTEIGTGWRVHVVRQHEVGMLDILADRYFGPGYEQAWWCIAIANGLLDPDADMFPGQKLWMPPSSLVDQYAGRTPA
jgi:hypothetical protein